jgi:lysophospholipase L1-like esterase
VTAPHLHGVRGLGPRMAWIAWLGAWLLPGPASASEAHVARIVFVGDSLVNRSQQDHGLLELVKQDLQRSRPDLVFELLNAGVNGNCIADIRARLTRDVLERAPAAVVLYWDSDAADVEADGELPARSRELREAYRHNLDAVLGALAAATSNVLVTGPTLLGERAHGRNPKDHVLDAYARINRRACRHWHATWIDTRKAAFRWLRQNAAPDDQDSRLLTEDGEHLSATGVALVAGEISAALVGQWQNPARTARSEPRAAALPPLPSGSPADTSAP